MDARHFMWTNLAAPSFVSRDEKMSYNDPAFYLAETKLKNRLEAHLKPSLGINPGRNAPVIK